MSAGKRNTAIWATEFLTTEIARSAWPLLARMRAVAFSTALPAMATITSPAKAREIPSDSMAGERAEMNQSETKAAPTPAAARSAIVDERGRDGPCGWIVAAV